MARQPAQGDLPGVLRRQSRSVADNRLYLSGVVSGRLAESEFAVVRAKKAAEAALIAANQAKTAATAAQSAATAASTAASNAQTAANNANSAANSALAAAAPFAAIGMFIANPSSTSPSSPNSGYTVIPEMSLNQAWGNHPVVVRFSMEVVPQPGEDGSTNGSMYLRFNGGQVPATFRTTNAQGAVGFTYVFNPNGSGTIDVVWSGFMRSLGLRRQLSVQRLP